MGENKISKNCIEDLKYQLNIIFQKIKIQKEKVG